MMGTQAAPERLFYDFCLEDHVPDDHLLRRIDGFLDLSDVRQKLKPFYCSIGRPSIDPELMIRMLIVGYCLAIRSERRLCEEVHLNLAYRWFCRHRRKLSRYAAASRTKWRGDMKHTILEAFERWKSALIDQDKQTTQAARHRANARVTSMEDLIAETPADDVEGVGIKLTMYVYMSDVNPETADSAVEQVLSKTGKRRIKASINASEGYEIKWVSPDALKPNPRNATSERSPVLWFSRMTRSSWLGAAL